MGETSLTFVRDDEEKFYFFDQIEKGWHHHHNVAKECGGQIASITSDAEYSIVEKLVRRNNNNNVDDMTWIGAHQRNNCIEEPDGCWMFPEYNNTISYSKWATGEPNNEESITGHAENCAVTKEQKWHDENCQNWHKAIYLFNLNEEFHSCELCEATEFFWKGSCVTAEFKDIWIENQELKAEVEEVKSNCYYYYYGYDDDGDYYSEESSDGVLRTVVFLAWSMVYAVALLGIMYAVTNI